MILHLCILDKFIPPFIEFTRKELGAIDNQFLIYGEKDIYPYVDGRDCTYIGNKNKFSKHIKMALEFNKAEKIILHGLFDKRVVQLLFLQPWLLSKCYWIIWGGDLYKDRDATKINPIKKSVARRINSLITYLEGDVELARQLYDRKAGYHECIAYTSNTFSGKPTNSSNETSLTILVGNSATISNNHMEILEQLKSLNIHKHQIVCPLSYGDPDYASEIENKGLELFGSNFKGLRKFLTLSEYNKFLDNVEIAVFAHKRQQGMGNIITLLGLGKKVFIDKETSTWTLLNKMGLIVFDKDQLSLTPLSQEEKENNTARVNEYFSLETLKKQWLEILSR